MRDATQSGPVLTAAVNFVGGNSATAKRLASVVAPGAKITTATSSALEALSSAVGALSHPDALKDAFRSYYAYKAAHPDES